MPPRIFIPSAVKDDTTVEVTGETARYLDAVLRAKHGDAFVLFDTEGMHYEAEVVNVSRSRVKFTIKKRLENPEPEQGGCVLVCAMLKGDKMELVIQKAVELGVSAIIPVVTKRTLVRETRKLKRWQSVSLEAARQSGRLSVPEVCEPLDLGKYLSANPGVEGVVFYEGQGVEPLKAEDFISADAPIVVVGPEGGFEPSEVEMMQEHGLKVRSLGRNVLRAETAAIAAVTLCQFLGRVR